MAYLITSADYLLLATVTTSGVMFTVVWLDDKGLRVDDLDKVVWMLLRGDSSTQVSFVKGTVEAVTYAKHRLHVS